MSMTPSKMAALNEAYVMLITAGPEKCMPVLLKMVEMHPDSLLRILKISDENAMDAVKDAVLDENYVEATRLYKEIQGCTSKAAKEAVLKMKDIIEKSKVVAPTIGPSTTTAP